MFDIRFSEEGKVDVKWRDEVSSGPDSAEADVAGDESQPISREPEQKGSTFFFFDLDSQPTARTAEESATSSKDDGYFSTLQAPSAPEAPVDLDHTPILDIQESHVHRKPPIDYASVLNSSQLEAVMTTEGPLLVIAGAGSGKTRVLTYRVAHLIEMGVNPYHILAITFTNKATKEMKERIDALCGVRAKGVWVSTFHAMCSRILRRYGEYLGYTTNFSIYDETQTQRIIKRILREKGLKEENAKKVYAWHISNAKNNGHNPDTYRQHIPVKKLDDAHVICDVYQAYEDSLRAADAMDYDDLLLKTLILFELHPEVLRVYQEQFEYILVDEYQDTNKVQYALIRRLSELYRNVFAVGDEDQSIYGWRGAMVQNIIDFPRDFPGAKQITLSQNYRSTARILEASNALIKNNTLRYGKTLTTENKEGEDVSIRPLPSDIEEARYVIDEIRTRMREKNCVPKDFAILVRANALTRKFEEQLYKNNIPYRVFAGNKFYDRKEIKDVLAYCKLVLNPKDNDSFLRVINTPRRGIGDVVISSLTEYAKSRRLSLMEAVFEIDHAPLPSTTVRKLNAFRAIFDDIFNYAKDHNAFDVVSYTVDRTQMKGMYPTESEEDVGKRMNIDELVLAVQEYCEEDDARTISEYIEEVALASQSDDIQDGNAVVLATVHAVKGLEFPVVFVVGLEDGIFPFWPDKKTEYEMEEERRCMYVAMTRAQEKLYLTNAEERFYNGDFKYNDESRFLKEIKLGLGIADTHAPRKKNRDDYWWQSDEYESEMQGGYSDDCEWASDIARIKASAKRISSPASRIANTAPSGTSFVQKPTAPAPAKNSIKLAMGSHVVHPKFGQGMVISLSGNTATIAFDNAGVKKLDLTIAPLDLL